MILTLLYELEVTRIISDSYAQKIAAECNILNKLP